MMNQRIIQWQDMESKLYGVTGDWTSARTLEEYTINQARINEKVSKVKRDYMRKYPRFRTAMNHRSPYHRFQSLVKRNPVGTFYTHYHRIYDKDYITNDLAIISVTEEYRPKKVYPWSSRGLLDFIKPSKFNEFSSIITLCDYNFDPMLVGLTIRLINKVSGFIDRQELAAGVYDPDGQCMAFIGGLRNDKS